MAAPFQITGYGWKQPEYIQNQSWVCGYCGRHVSSDRGYSLHQHKDASGGQVGGAYICPNCNGTSLIVTGGDVFPSHTMGNPVTHLPEAIEKLYDEARSCSSEKNFTATVMVCRKILMNVAVDRGAKDGLRFIEYVNYLAENGYIPPNGRHWVDHIRKKGNEANHEITIMSETDAQELLTFVEMLLRFVHEFPNMIPNPEGAQQPPERDK
jgi:hypothetical protein